MSHAPSELPHDAAQSGRGHSVLVIENGLMTSNAGGGVRSRALLAALKARGDVHVVSVMQRRQDKGDAAPISDVASIVYPTSRATHLPIARLRRLLTLNRRIRRQMNPKGPNDVQRAINELVSQNDAPTLVVLRYSLTARAADIATSPLRDKMFVWLDLDDREDKFVHDLLAHSKSPVLRAIAGWVARRFQAHLRKISESADLVTVSSMQDVDGISQRTRISHLANVVPSVPLTDARVLPSQGHGLLYVASYGYEPNRDGITWFLNNCWPRIIAANPDASMTMVGTGPAKERTALQDAFAHLSGVAFRGEVDDLQPLYAACRAVISPVRLGSGSKIKVIEAAAYGRPTVTSTHSTRGLHGDLSRHLSVAKDANDFADQCIHYITDPDAADRDGAALMAAQREHHATPSFIAAVNVLLSRSNTDVPTIDRFAVNVAPTSLQKAAAQ